MTRVSKGTAGDASPSAVADAGADSSALSRERGFAAWMLAPPSRSLAWRLALLILIPASLLLFVRLGHYALWEDEALTAIPAVNIWHTGDMSAMWGKNIAAFHDGVELTGRKFRYMPPLQYYVAAPFVGTMTTALGARLPFALCGLGCIAMLPWWLWRVRAPTSAWVFMGMAILGNVSFFLYCRQCRYYGLVLLLSVLLAYHYVYWNGQTRRLIWIALLSIALFASNYLNFLAAYACLGVDYLLFARRDRRLSWKQFAVILVPLAIFGVPIAMTWNPMLHPYYKPVGNPWITERLLLFFFGLRDLVNNEFIVTLPILGGIIVGIFERDRWMRRLSLAMLVYFVAISLISPQPITRTDIVDVRYLIVLIPMGIGLCVLFLQRVARASLIAACIVALLASFTNVLHINAPVKSPAQWVHSGSGIRLGFHSMIVEYLHELHRPPPEPYSEAVRWIDAHIPPGKMVVISPRLRTAIFLFHAPQMIYGWQLTNPSDPALLTLPDFNFAGRVPPDYIIRYSLELDGEVDEQMRRYYWAGYKIKQIDSIPVFSYPLYRPELFLRLFRPIDETAANSYPISIWKVTPPAPDGRRRSAETRETGHGAH